jgi:hypothetical protein
MSGRNFLSYIMRRQRLCREKVTVGSRLSRIYGTRTGDRLVFLQHDVDIRPELHQASWGLQGELAPQ